MTAVMLRKPGWGYEFGKVVNLTSTKIKSVKQGRDKRSDYEGVTHVINWGHNPNPIRDDLTVLNSAEAVSETSNKGKFRLKVQEEFLDIVPRTWRNVGSFDGEFPVIVRPNRHMQGQNMHFCETMEEVRNAARQCGEHHYISEYIPKVAEYRVYIVQGKAFAVSQKVVENPEAVAWNHAGGDCEFVNVRWDNWPIPVVSAACNAFSISGLDFGGIDIMVDADGRAYVLEINSALSLPMLEDGGAFIDCISYHQKAMIKCLEWAVEGKDPVYNYQGRKENSYHQYIHAAMKERINAG